MRRLRLLVPIAIGAGLALTVLRWASRNGTPVRAAPAGELRVCPGGPPTCDYGSVQAAVEAADEGSVIKVAEGTYTNVHAREGITQVLYISKTVMVRGGYTPEDWDTPDADAHPTTLDARGLGRVVYIEGYISPALVGLRITGGDATGLGGVIAEEDAGGGVYIYYATATISGCVVYSNTASTASYGYGGGLYLWTSDSTLEGNTVVSNTASSAGEGYGGGMRLDRSPATLRRNVVAHNQASTASYAYGGGMSLWSSDASVEGNTVRGNIASTADSGFGGGLALQSSGATLERNTVSGNTASTGSSGTGGGVYLSDSLAVLRSNLVEGNTGSTASRGYGGGLNLLYSDATLEGNTVRSNTASTADEGYGGGLALDFSGATLEGNTVSGNTASTLAFGRAGGLLLGDSPATLLMKVVEGNTGSTAGQGEGGGLYLSGCDATLRHNTIRGNIASTADYGFGGGIYLLFDGSTLENNAVQGNTASTGGTGYGGGLRMEVSDATLTANTILSNTASTADQGSGGGLHLSESAATLEGNTVQSNTASTASSGWAGGLYLSDSPATLLGNLVEGNAASTADGGSGGGLYLSESDATLGDNTVRGNTASTGGSGSGGGMYLRGTGGTLENNTVQDNTASTAGVGNGGGLQLRSSNATLTSNTILTNTASSADNGYGGGLGLRWSDATLRGNTVQANVASTVSSADGGGLFMANSDAFLEGNCLLGNAASTASWGRGGGLYLQAGRPMLGGNSVVGNWASTAGNGWGGGLFLVDSSATLQGNTVASNTASTAGEATGGGLYLITSAASLEGNQVEGNTASASDRGAGGGMHLVLSNARLEGNTVVSNTATLSATAEGRGGGLAVDGGYPFTLTNNLVAGNHATTEGSGLYLAGVHSSDPARGYLRHTTIAQNGPAVDSGGQGIYVGKYATLFFTNTIISGHSGAGITATDRSTVALEATLWHGNGINAASEGTLFTGTANLYDDPAFVDPAAWDYHLAAGSPAIDAGVDAGVVADIDGEFRPHGAGYDIGADEFNRLPEAVAGADQIVDTLATVALDGSGSSDPEGDLPLSYGWTQTGGLPVILSSRSAVSPTFTAPDDPGPLTFVLVVTDSVNGRDPAPDEVVVTVNNQSPQAVAGPDQAVATLSIVTLDGDGSTDPDGDTPLSYRWTQTGGELVSLSDPAVASPTFVAQDDPAVLIFSLAVTDSLGLPGVDPDQVVITVTNQPPVADAGADQIIATLAAVTLDGSASSDLDGDMPLSYSWMQTGGPDVALSSGTAMSPTFVAPADPTVLTFTLAVTDNLGLPDPTPDQVVVTISDTPIADAGADQTVGTNATVTLNGSASSDPDGETLAYWWTQTGGPAVTLSGRTSVSPTFVAPPDPAVLSFTLVVTDTLGLSDATPDGIVVTVTNSPVADAGPDQTVYALDLVTLDGSASSDPEGDMPLSYAWAQVGGPGVTLSSGTVVSPTFTAPADLTVLTFTLAVTDSLGLPDPTPDQVVVTVKGQQLVYLPLVARGLSSSLGWQASRP